MPDLINKSDKTQANTKTHAREDSEYVRLVISNEPRTAEADASQSQTLTKRSSAWWMKALMWCFTGTIILLVFVKWGVPFFFEKVCSFLHYKLFENVLLVYAPQIFAWLAVICKMSKVLVGATDKFLKVYLFQVALFAISVLFNKYWLRK